MNNNLVYYVYKLTFQSGRTYIGCHKQKKENDKYITSSSYYKNHPEDSLLKREILIEVKDEMTMDFLETWCILSDKAYNPKSNVNYNLGNFFHRFSSGYRTEEEKQKSVERLKHTMSLKTPEELQAIADKRKATMAAKSPEELAEIHRRIGNSSANYWKNLSEEEHQNFCTLISEARKRYWENLSEEELNKFKENLSKAKTGLKPNLTDEQRQKMSEVNRERWMTQSEDVRAKRLSGFYEASEKRKKRIQCIETGEVFEQLQDIRNWLGPKAKGCNVSAQARGKVEYAYRHPITGEKLHWKFV